MAGKRETTSFTREATGLVRELSWLDVFVWSIIFFPWLSSWSGLFWVTPDSYQNVDYYVSLGVWAVIALVVVVLYWQLTVVMPRSGGDYVFVSRAISGWVGFIASFVLYIALVADPASTGAYWAFAESGTQLSFAGQVLNDPGIISLGNLINPFSTSAPWFLFLVSGLLLGVGAVGVLVGGRLFRTIIYGFFAYGAFAMVLVMVMFALNSQTTFASDYARYFQGGVPQVFSEAAAAGYTPGYSLAALGLVVPVIFVSLGPFPTMQLVGGEIRNPRRSLLLGSVGAELASILIFFVLTYLFDHSVGISFIEAWTVDNQFSSTVPSALAFVFYPNTVLLWLIVIGLFIGNIGWWWLALVFASRLPMAWSFDRVVPSPLAHVSDRFHTPTFSTILTVGLATIPMYLIFFTSFISAQLNGVFLLSVAWLLASLAAIIYPFRHRGVFKAQGGSRVLGIPVLSLVGLMALIVLGYFSYNAFVNPAIGPVSEASHLVVLGIVVASILIYLVSSTSTRGAGST